MFKIRKVQFGGRGSPERQSGARDGNVRLGSRRGRDKRKSRVCEARLLSYKKTSDYFDGWDRVFGF